MSQTQRLFNIKIIFLFLLSFLTLRENLTSCENQKNIIPSIQSDNKSHTHNSMGYVFFTLTPVGESFLENECYQGKKVLEIGTGFSNLPILAMLRGVTEYIANDLSEEHLDILKNKVKESKLEPGNGLKFLTGKAPEVLEKLKGQAFDAILAEKVIHFFTPTEIEEFIERSKNLLKVDGKIYVTAASPYSEIYSKTLATYLERKGKGEKFPGYFLDMKERLNPSELGLKKFNNFQVPDTMTLFSREDLVRTFKESGFKILASYSLRRPTEEEAKWLECNDDKSNIVGIIAEMPRRTNSPLPFQPIKAK